MADKTACAETSLAFATTLHPALRAILAVDSPITAVLIRVAQDLPIILWNLSAAVPLAKTTHSAPSV
jgi:hypothetical protein